MTLLDTLDLAAGLVFFALITVSLYFTRPSASVRQVWLAVALDLAAAGTQVVSLGVVAVSDAYTWVSVVVCIGIGLVCLAVAGLTWARASRMEATR